MDLVKKSADVIKRLQVENGGILATPKDGAYPYVYVRDAVIMTKALNRMGFSKNSKKFYYFFKKISKLENYNEVFHRYNPDGTPRVTRKNENDNTGLVIHGIYDTYLSSKDDGFLKEMWPVVQKISDIIISYMKRGLVKTNTSIHEYEELEKGYEIWSNSACARGLLDASEIAKKMGMQKQEKLWKKKAEKIKSKMQKKLFNKKLGVFIKNKKYPSAPDISQLAPFYFGLIDSKEILKKTLEEVEKYLWNEEIGGYRRFRKFEICKDWHWYTGGSGSWGVLTAWVAESYRILGDKKNYRRCINWVEKIAEKSGGLIPEHIATKDEYYEWKNHEIEFESRIIDGMKKAEGNVEKINGKDIYYWANPLGWSHAEYILAKTPAKDQDIK